MSSRNCWSLRNPIALVSTVVLTCCFVILCLTMLRLPDPTTTTYTTPAHRHSNNHLIGKLGEMMLEMLPEDLPFTVFLPSERAFERDLRLKPNNITFFNKDDTDTDTYAVVSRVLGFSAVPRSLMSEMVPFRKDGEMSYDSISGFVLYMSKNEDGVLVVNGVLAERVNLMRNKGSLTVHVMDGVLMDAEFQQSVQYDGEED